MVSFTCPLCDWRYPVAWNRPDNRTIADLVLRHYDSHGGKK